MCFVFVSCGFGLRYRNDPLSGFRFARSRTIRVFAIGPASIVFSQGIFIAMCDRYDSLGATIVIPVFAALINVTLF